MYSDYFYDFLNSGLPWMGISIIYACFDYLYNLIMCSLFGGVSRVRKYYSNYPPRLGKAFFARTIKEYKYGSRKLLQDFFADKLSWSWPITVLAIPTAIYGISRELTINGVLSLELLGVNFQNYVALPNNNYIQIFIWGIAFTIGMRSFYRYQKERSKPTWFSKMWAFSFSRTLLFDIPLAYMILNIIYIWLQYSFSLFRVLSSDQIHYTIFHPDLMYGLRKVYNTVIAMGVSLTILSFLPTIMLVREKGQKYSKMYVFLIYGGIITLFLLLSLLVIKFDQRLENIQRTALDSIQIKINSGQYLNSVEQIASIEYFSLILNFPGGFPIPAWFNVLLSARSVALFFEIIKIVSPSTFKLNITKILQKVLEN